MTTCITVTVNDDRDDRFICNKRGYGQSTSPTHYEVTTGTGIRRISHDLLYIETLCFVLQATNIKKFTPTLFPFLIEIFRVLTPTSRSIESYKTGLLVSTLRVGDTCPSSLPFLYFTFERIAHKFTFVKSCHEGINLILK